MWKLSLTCQPKTNHNQTKEPWALTRRRTASQKTLKKKTRDMKIHAAKREKKMKAGIFCPTKSFKVNILGMHSFWKSILMEWDMAGYLGSAKKNQESPTWFILWFPDPYSHGNQFWNHTFETHFSKNISKENVGTKAELPWYVLRHRAVNEPSSQAAWFIYSPT